MTDLVQNLKIGNNTYAIQDGNTLPALTAAQRTVLLSNGTYLGKAVANGVKFENDSGKFEQFSDTITGTTLAWSTTSLPTSRTFCIAYGDGLYVTLSSGKAMRSTNGSSWSSVDLPVSGTWFGLTYGNGVFVAVGIDSTNAIYSTDGEHWNTATLPASRSWYSVAYGNGVFAAVAAENTNKGAYSDDGGQTWNEMTLSSTGSWTQVTYGPSGFLAVRSSSNVSSISSDGIHWSGGTMPSSSSWIGLVYGNGVYAAIPRYSSSVYFSEDLSTWSSAVIPISSDWISMTYGDGIFAITSQNSSSMVYGAGSTWSSIKIQETDAAWNSITYGNGKFIAVAAYAGKSASGIYTVTHNYSLTPLSYTKSEVDIALAGKQGTLTAGNGIDISSDTISAEEMVGADGVNIGKAGAVPRPAATDNTKFLRGDGTWAEAGGGGSASYDSTTQEITLG